MLSSGDVIILYAIVVSVLGAGAILIGLHRWRRRRDAALFRVAERLGGVVATVEGLDLPSLRFSIEGRPALIEFERGDEHHTRVKVSMPRRSPGVFRIFRQNAARANARYRGVPDLRIGHQAFDHAWYITARPESLARRIFTEDRRDQVIDSVLRIGRLPRPSIEITRDTLIVRSNGLLRHEDELIDLAQAAIDFVGFILRLGPEDGIAWVVEGEQGPGLCPVCAASMEEEVVQCDKCRTPHHRECWTYVGQCSTYACKGKRFVA